MRLNGLYVVAEMALRQTPDPLLQQWRKTLILGSLREDVWYIPGIGEIVEHLSFSHFYEVGWPGGFIPFLWPGPRFKGNLFYARALRAYRSGDIANAFVQLGRVVHLLTDMSCPVHAHRSAHATDPFEWYVEGNKDELLSLPVPHVPDVERASDLMESMARITYAHRPDDTNTLHGYVLARLGLRKRVTKSEAAQQARELIPICGGHAASLLRLFLRDVTRPREGLPTDRSASPTSAGSVPSATR
jgi:hypothetical protein